MRAVARTVNVYLLLCGISMLGCSSIANLTSTKTEDDDFVSVMNANYDSENGVHYPIPPDTPPQYWQGGTVAAEISLLTQELDEALVELEQQTAQTDALATDKQQLQTKVAKCEAEVARLRRELKSTQLLLEEADFDVARASHEVEEFRKQLASWQSEAEQLRVNVQSGEQQQQAEFSEVMRLLKAMIEQVDPDVDVD